MRKLDRVAAFREVVERELTSPHRLSDLAVDGVDLIQLGYRPGPAARQRPADAARRGRRRTEPQPARMAARARRGAPALVIRWDAPGPYVVAFTTREGGVSTGRLRLAEPRQPRRRRGPDRREPPDRLCRARARRRAARRQPAAPHRRRCIARGPARTRPAMRSGGRARRSRCSRSPPTASRSRSRPRPGRRRWRSLMPAGAGLPRDRRGNRRRARRIRRPRRSSGPRSARAATRWARRFRPGSTTISRDGRMLDLWTAAERALRRAGVGTVERLDRCTRCHSDEFFSHRASGVPHGSQGVIGALAG